MKNLEGLKLVTRGEREIVMTRELMAPCRLVFHAFTKAGVGEALVTRAAWRVDAGLQDRPESGRGVPPGMG
jgi:hypothetical protein